jgi:glycerophosphoryl diester phosphodiesterase
MSTPAPTPVDLDIFRSARLAVRRSIGPMLLYEIVFRLFRLLLLGPLLVALLNALIRLSGQPAITNTGLLSFLLTPLGIITLILYLGVAYTQTCVESAGLLVISLRTFRGLPVSAGQTMRKIALHLPKLLGLSLLQVGLVLLAVLPFALLGALTWWLLLSGSDINYYLAEKPVKFYVAAGIGGVLALGLAVVLILLSVRWLFVVPACLFEGETGTDALRASSSLVRGHTRRILVFLVGWLAFRFALFFGVLFLLDRLNAAVLAPRRESNALLAWTFICLLLNGLLLAAVSLLENIAFNLLLAWLYEDLHRRRSGEPMPERLLDAGEQRPTRWWLRLAAWVTLGFLATSTMGHAVFLADLFAARKPVAITAHRAGAHGAPENTVAALRQAIGDGADFAEIDVQLTADGVVVVLHDSDVRRLTGVMKKLSQMTLDEVKNLRFRGKEIATLEEFIEEAQGKIKLNIELKYYGHDPKLAESVVKLLHRHDFVSDAIISSLENKGLEEVRRFEPRLRIGKILAASVGDLKRLDIDFLSVRKGLLTQELREDAYGRGWEVHVWGVNTRRDMEGALDLDADNLITDEPLLARQVLDSRQEIGDMELILRRLHAWLRA